MLVYDINSFPDDLDISVWYNLFEKGLAVYDSKKGIEPFQFDQEGLSLIDISEMTQDDMIKIGNHIAEINEEYHQRDVEANSKIIENNKKLVEYLKSINKLNT